MSYGESLYARSLESLEGIPTSDMMSLLRVKTEHAITIEGVERRLASEEPLKVKFGTDPTGPDLHLGHIVPIRLLDLFNRAGHTIDLIFGDFTAKVGDPTERESGRPLLSDEKIAENMSTFRDQVDRYFDTNRDNVRIHRNGDWLGVMSLGDIFGYLQAINLTEATQRKDFRDRMQRGQSVSLAETVYGTLMGIDSVHLNTDIEIGGIDQLLNFQQTRTVQRSIGQEAEEILMTPIIEGTSGDGRKMSKSYGNYIPVFAGASEVFGKIMSIPDELVVPYFKAFAPVYETDVQRLEESVKREPFDTKKQLAAYLVNLSQGDSSAGPQARHDFEKRFSERKIELSDATILEFRSISLIDILHGSGDFKSKGELKRLVEQGGVRVNGKKITPDSLNELVEPESLIAVGRRRLYAIGKD